MSGVLTLYMSATSGNITIPDQIAVESLTLKAYRWEYTSDANARTSNILTVSTPWTRVGSVNSGIDLGVDSAGAANTDCTHVFNGLAIPIGHDHIGVVTTNMTFDIGRVIERTFPYSITGFTLTGFSNLTLIFEYRLK